MQCQIWRFQLKNTLNLSHKKRINIKESATLFFKTTLFFLRSFDVVYHMFQCIKQTFHKNNKCIQVKLEKEMWCQIMRFPLINTLKLSRKKKNNSRNPQQCSSKLLCFKCPSVCLSVCSPLRYRLFAPTSQSQMSKKF